MDIRVSGHQVDTGDALRSHVSDRISGIADKYFSRAIAATVTFGRGPHDFGFTCDIVAPVVQGVVLKASNKAGEARLAFDGAADKVEKQLVRYVKRLRDHKGSNGTPALVENAAYTVFAPAADEEEPPANPPIIAETRVDIPRSSVSDAVMLMDLRNTIALLFTNSKTGALNMIYRREDGNIGWVEPKA